MKLAFAIIVAARDEEAEPLARCLESVADYVDGIFVTITGKNEKVEMTAKLFTDNVSYFDWVDDFAKARNYNFSQIPKDYDYILWLDADDILRGAELLRNIIEEHPADCYSLNYCYAWDEWKNPTIIHQKVQIVKNDGCVQWVGRLHEDFTNNREVSTYFIKGIERLHLTDDIRTNSAKERNVRISQEEVKDKPDDPRSYWNLANSLKGNEQYEESIKEFEKFLIMSQSDEEKYIARLRMAEAYWGLDKKGEAINQARHAVGIRPMYPDAYHLLGSLYLATNQLSQARDSYLMGLSMKPPVYEIIVYNPRDYDLVPLKNLAKVYIQMSMPQLALPCLEGALKITPQDKQLAKLVETLKTEANKANKVVEIVGKLRKLKNKAVLKKRLDEIPDELKAHPLVSTLRNQNFIKTESSGHDLVFLCGLIGGDEPWTPQTAQEKGIGGSEEAVIWLAMLLKEKGWNVTVYNNCGYKELEFDGVKYKPFWMFNPKDKQDVCVIWRLPRYAYETINCTRLYIDLHDTIMPGEFTGARLEKITKIFVKSKFHRSLYPDIPDEKFAIISNGIDPLILRQPYERDPMLLINTSSPDRGLNVLLDLFAEVKKQVPEVKLVWAYGWNVYDQTHAGNPKMMEWKDMIVKKMEAVGCENLGRLSHPEIAKLYLKANVFAYPSEFAEIDCISLSKAQAGGAIPVTTDFAAMGEKQDIGGYFIHSEKTKDTWCRNYQMDFSMEGEEKKRKWVDYVVKLLKESPSEDDRQEMRKKAQGRFSWDIIANRWDKILSNE